VTGQRGKVRLIRRVWVERGKTEWGNGLGPVTVRLSPAMKAPPAPGQSLLLPESLTFKLRTSTVKGKLINEIVCEGVVVETLMPSA
jgi:hypothetical protein